MLTENTKLYLKFLLFLWITAVIFRLGFLFWQWVQISAHSSADILKAFYIGVRFDGRIAAFISLPLFIFLFTPGLKRFFGGIRPYLLVFYTVLYFIYILIYMSDAAHYAYLQLRINFAALELAEDTAEAVGMVWQTYPVIKLFIAAAAVCAVMFFITKKLFNSWNKNIPAYKKSVKVFSSLVCVFVVSILIYGQYRVNYFPLRWSEAYFSGYNEITALGLNPIHNIIDTKTKNAVKDNTELARQAYDSAVRYLKIDDIDKDNIRYDRFVNAKDTDRPNIVIIVIESMSMHKSSFMFDDVDTTLFLKELAGESLYFPNYYAPARTTARAMFSIVTGIPDAGTSFSSSSRDPYIVDQHTIWSEFDGYSKLYMLGGNANWANIRGIMTNNIPDIKIYEEGYWKSPKMDVWGISDKDLLQEANEILEKEKEPFISIIQLASFHRPFTVPSGMADFDYTMPSQDYLDRYGFVDGEYLSMKFCDYAIRKYFEAAKNSSYYNNTIFIVTGDHGITEMSPSAGENYQGLRLYEYHVPLIIHYPKMFPKGEVRYETGSHVDIFPTAANLAGISYQNTTLGRDLLDPQYGRDRFVLIRRTDRPPVLINGEYCFSEELDGSALYKRELNNINADWKLYDGDKVLYDRLEKETQDLWQTVLYMLYHNSKERAASAEK